MKSALSGSELYDVFLGLLHAPPHNASYLAAAPISPSYDLAAVNSYGDLFFLLVDDGEGTRHPLTSVFRHVTLMTGRRFNYVSAGKPSSGVFTCVQLTSAPSLEKAFALLGSVLLESLGSSRSTARVSAAVKELSDLLAVAGGPGRKTLQGVWAELHYISQAQNREPLVQAWHQTANATHDFSLPALNIEVKSSKSVERRHHFSLSQLTAGKTTKVVSYLLDEDAAGQSVLELATSIAVSLSEDDARLLWKKVTQCLGSDMNSVDEIRYGLRSDSEPLELHADEVERVMIPEGSSIRDVNFSVLLGKN